MTSELPQASPPRLRNVVFVLTDISTIGGIPNRTRVTLSHAVGRDVAFHGLTQRNDFGIKMDNVYSIADNFGQVRRQLAQWTPSDTVFILANNSLKPFPPDVIARVREFPIVHFSAGQMAFFIKNSNVLRDLDYVDSARAMRIISLSDSDINFQRQLGIFGQVKGTVPVAQRAENTYDIARNTRLGYVGRIEFHAKDCMKLVDVARAMQGSPMLPIRVFTTDGRNSPRYQEFRTEIERQNLSDAFEFIVNCTDKNKIFRDIGILLLPSKMEGFGNVVVEACSYGIPVIAASYAPGPSEIIQHGQSGFLLDRYTGEAVRDAITGLSLTARTAMSEAAFARHRLYSVDLHIDFLEQVCRDSLNDFRGKNIHPVYPRLHMIETLPALQRAPQHNWAYRGARQVYRLGRRTLGLPTRG